MEQLQEHAITVVRTVSNEWFIICSLSHRSDTQVIRVDSFTGELVFEGVVGFDCFTSHDHALGVLLQRAAVDPGQQFEQQISVQAIIGLFLADGVAVLVVATKTRCDVPLLHKHKIQIVTEAKMIEISLHVTASHASHHIAKRRIAQLKEFPLESCHFFCNTFDLTRPFPSSFGVWNHDRDWCWNEYMCKPFADIGLRDCAVVLLEGAVSTRQLDHDADHPSSQPTPDVPTTNTTTTTTTTTHPSTTNNGRRIGSAVITRKSCLNPGTRYYARGVNATGEPGNEMECDVVVWSCLPSASVEPKGEWRSFVWRRGTVPVWWKTDLKSSVSQPEIIVSNTPFQGVEQYYQRIVKRYTQEMPPSSNPEEPNTIFMHMLNLLRCAPDKPETKLTEAYAQSLRELRQLSTNKTLPSPMLLLNFDWHENTKILGLHATVEGMWARLCSGVKDMGFSVGVFGTDIGDRGVGGHGQGVAVGQRQQGILRINCADSLDRTNLCGFFVTLQVFVELLRRVNALDAYTPADKQLQKLHVPEEWCYFGCRVSELVDSIPSAYTQFLAETFVECGDIGSYLYTNTPAMLTSELRSLTPNLAAPRHNTLLTLQRRYENVVNDSSKQQQFEFWLGLKSLSIDDGMERISHLTARPAMCLSVTMPSQTDTSPTALCDSADVVVVGSGSINLRWCTGSQKWEGIFKLSRPGKVTNIGLSTGLCTSNSDSVIASAWGGPNTTELVPLLENVFVPSSVVHQATNGSVPNSHMFFKVSQGWGNSKVMFYDFGGDDMNCVQFVKISMSMLPPLPSNMAQSDGIVSCGVSVLGVCQQDKLPKAQRKDAVASQLYFDELRKMIPRVKTLEGEGSCKGKLFGDMLRLESLRVQANVETAQRNLELSRASIKVYLFDPHFHVLDLNEHSEKAVRKSAMYNVSVCSTPGCRTKLGFVRKSCHYCRKKFCGNCMNAQTGSILHFGWLTQHKLCKPCFAVAQSHADYVTRITQLQSTSTPSLQGVHPVSTTRRSSLLLGDLSSLDLFRHTQGEKGPVVSFWPHAGIVSSPRAHESSASPEQLLLRNTSSKSTWISAEPHTKSMEFVIALHCRVILTTIEVEVPYDADKPPHQVFSFQLATSNTIDRWDRTFTWVVNESHTTKSAAGTWLCRLDALTESQELSNASSCSLVAVRFVPAIGHSEELAHPLAQPTVATAPPLSVVGIRVWGIPAFSGLPVVTPPILQAKSLPALQRLRVRANLSRTYTVRDIRVSDLTLDARGAVDGFYVKPESDYDATSTPLVIRVSVAAEHPITANAEPTQGLAKTVCERVVPATSLGSHGVVHFDFAAPVISRVFSFGIVSGAGTPAFGLYVLRRGSAASEQSTSTQASIPTNTNPFRTAQTAPAQNTNPFRQQDAPANSDSSSEDGNTSDA